MSLPLYIVALAIFLFVFLYVISDFLNVKQMLNNCVCNWGQGGEKPEFYMFLLFSFSFSQVHVCITDTSGRKLIAMTTEWQDDNEQ